MKFGFGLYSSILLIFFFNMLVLGGIMLKQGLSQKMKPALWLAVMVLLLAMYIAPFLFGYAGWYGLDGYREVLFYLPLQQLFFLGPVFLFYLKSLLYPDYQFKKSDWLHFAPGAAYLLYNLFIFVSDNILGIQPLFYQDGRDKDFDLWYQVTGFLSLIIYFILSLNLYARYRRQIYEQLSYAEDVTYTWVRSFLIFFLAILLLRAIFFIINPEWGEFGRKFWYYFSIALMGNYLALQGYRQSILMSASLLPLSAKAPAPATTSTDPGQVTGKDSLPPAQADLLARIALLMRKEHAYKDPLLTLSGLAESLQTTPKNISQAINNGTGLNFNDFINQYRVNAVVHAIEQGDHKQHTLLGIAVSCGFNSKSTFNRAFKKFSGHQPNEFVRLLEKKGVKS